MKCIICGKEESPMSYDPVPAKKHRHITKGTHWLCLKHYKERFDPLVEMGWFTREAFNLILENSKRGLIGFKSYTGIEYNIDKEAWDVKEVK